MDPGNHKSTDPGGEPETDLIGQTLGDGYRVVRQIELDALCGHYQVTRADGSGGKFVAAVVHARHAQDETRRRRLERNAATLKGLDDENIARIVDLGRTSDDRPFVVYEHPPGQSLADLLEDKGKMDLGPAIRMVRRVCQALAAGHLKRIVHHDIRPQNIYLTGDPRRHRCKVLGFGLWEFKDASMLTPSGSGMSVATASYVAPEQARGDIADHRADIYSAGALLFSALTGRPPVDPLSGASVPSPRSINPDISEAVEAVILRAMAPDPADRFRFMNQFDVELMPHDDSDADLLDEMLGEFDAAFDLESSDEDRHTPPRPIKVRVKDPMEEKLRAAKAEPEPPKPAIPRAPGIPRPVGSSPGGIPRPSASAAIPRPFAPVGQPTIPDRDESETTPTERPPKPEEDDEPTPPKGTPAPDLPDFFDDDLDEPTPPKGTPKPAVAPPKVEAPKAAVAPPKVEAPKAAPKPAIKPPKVEPPKVAALPTPPSSPGIPRPAAADSAPGSDREPAAEDEHPAAVPAPPTWLGADSPKPPAAEERTPSPTAPATDEATPSPAAAETAETTPSPAAAETDEATPSPAAAETAETTPSPAAAETAETTPSPTEAQGDIFGDLHRPHEPASSPPADEPEPRPQLEPEPPRPVEAEAPSSRAPLKKLPKRKPAAKKTSRINLYIIAFAAVAAVGIVIFNRLRRDDDPRVDRPVATASPRPTKPPATTKPSTQPKATTDADLQKQLRDSVSRKQHEAATQALAELAKRDWKLLEGDEEREAVLDLLLQASKLDGQAAERPFELCAEKLGSLGPDLLFDLHARRGGSAAAERAWKLLEDEKVRERGTPALRIAYDIRAALNCDGVVALLHRAKSEGDLRTKEELERVRSCQPGTRCCMRGNQKIDTVIRALGHRLGDASADGDEADAGATTPEPTAAPTAAVATPPGSGRVPSAPVTPPKAPTAPTAPPKPPTSPTPPSGEDVYD